MMRKAVILTSVFLSLVGIVIGVVATGLEGSDRWWPVSWLAWAPVGAVILWKRPGNGVGRALLAIGLSWGLSFVGQAIAINSSSSSVRAWSEMVGDLLGVVPWLAIIWLLLVFPTGRLLGLLERLIGTGVVGFGVYGVLSFTMNSSPMDTTGLKSPLAVSALDPVTAWLVSDAGFSVVLVLAVGALVSLVIRWRRSDGVERHQFRWLLFGSTFYIVILAVGQVASEDNALMVLWITAGAAIPSVIGVAVLRYRLYEIDRIVSRTVAYSVVVVLLGAVFALGVVAIPNLVMGTGATPPLLVAGSTLVVAALFNPVRRRVFGWVDRRFNRSRYDAESVMDDFAGSLRDQTDAVDVLDGWVGVVSETMKPSSVGVWVRS